VHLRVATIAGGVAGSVIVARALPSLASLFGKDASFAARRDVWDFVVDAVRQRPLTGYGFASFWDDPKNIATQYDQIGRLGLFAHSTFIETLLDLGTIGLALLIVVVVFSVGMVWWTALGNTEWAMAWWTATAMFALVENLAESMILYHSIFWVLLVAPGFAALRNASRYSAAAKREHTAEISGGA
jgi:exopolysaccharide production protein ExoQ